MKFCSDISGALRDITSLKWRDGRVVEGGGLENRCGATHRGFESLSLRHKIYSIGEMAEWPNAHPC